MKKNVEYIDTIKKWKGKNYFCISDIIIQGPSNLKPFLMIISLLIFLPLILFSSFELKVSQFCYKSGTKIIKKFGLLCCIF